ncbi:hypothetical protein [Mesorhizobium sp. B2-1-2]|uniref:hypothetical protein n=1 Tax=Mesorhizobium sp. B2-1-2 TaxID=2589973 RepID=UPI0017464607|nr:hypothetical protein [Mesorhizobium sp. B2-1-2]
MTHPSHSKAYPQTWVTNETPPRLLSVKGVALMDPDCLVAHVVGSDHGPLWIVEYDGHVIGLDGNIKAIQCNALPPYEGKP